MTFLTPWSAVFAAAAAVPLLLLLYVLRLRRQQLRIPSTLLWQKSFEDLQANVPFQRLRWSILLLLQLLMVLLLLLALAQPMIHGDGNAATRIVLLIDHSASMNAAGQGSGIRGEGSETEQTAGGLTRLDEAKRMARDMVNAMGRGDRARQMMIIAFAATPTIITTYESNRAVLLDAIASIEQTDEHADLAAALELAGAYSGGAGATDNATGETDSGNDMTEVVLLSDGGVSEGRTNGTFTLRAGAFRFVNVVASDQRSAISDQPSADSSDGSGQNAERRSLNASINNLGISSFSIRRNIDDPARVEVFARLINAGPAPVTTTLTIFVNGEVVTTLRRTIPAATADAPGEDVLLQPIDLTSDALLTLRHHHTDDLPSDDVASLVVPAPAPPRLALVHPNDRPADAFLNDLLTALQPGELRVLTADGFANLDAAAIDSGGLFDLIVLDRVMLPRLPKVATISFGAKPPATADLGLAASRLSPADQEPPSSGESAIQPTPNRQSSIVNRQSTASRIVSWDRQHPLMRSVSLDTIVYAGFDGFPTLPSGANILAHGMHGPVMIEWPAGHVRHAAVGFELTKSNWPLHVGSAIFMQNAVDVLTPARLSAMGLSYHAGEPITVRALPDAASIVIRALPHADTTTASITAESAPVDTNATSQRNSPTQSSGEIQRTRTPDITIPVSSGELVTLPVLRRAGLYAVDGAAVPNDRVAVNVMSEAESDIRPRESLMVNAEQATARSGSAAMAQPLWPWLVMAAFVLLVIEWLVYCRKAVGT